MYCRGIRGATTVEQNEEQEILTATEELLAHIITENGLSPEHIAHVIVTVTSDLDATFPARVIRQLDGWELVPVMCALEVPVKGALPKCIRFMVTVNTTKSQAEMVHVYLNGAKVLRPDLAAR